LIVIFQQGRDRVSQDWMLILHSARVEIGGGTAGAGLRIREWEWRRGADLSTREPRGGGQRPSLPQDGSGGRRSSLLHVVCQTPDLSHEKADGRIIGAGADVVGISDGWANMAVSDIWEMSPGGLGQSHWYCP